MVKSNRNIEAKIIRNRTHFQVIFRKYRRAEFIFNVVVHCLYLMHLVATHIVHDDADDANDADDGDGDGHGNVGHNTDGKTICRALAHYV